MKKILILLIVILNRLHKVQGRINLKIGIKVQMNGKIKLRKMEENLIDVNKY